MVLINQNSHILKLYSWLHKFLLYQFWTFTQRNANEFCFVMIFISIENCDKSQNLFVFPPTKLSTSEALYFYTARPGC